jgi:hypothetical protein
MLPAGVGHPSTTGWQLPTNKMGCVTLGSLHAEREVQAGLTSFKAIAALRKQTASITRVPLLMTSVSKGALELRILARGEPEVTCTPQFVQM